MSVDAHPALALLLRAPRASSLAPYSRAAWWAPCLFPFYSQESGDTQEALVRPPTLSGVSTDLPLASQLMNLSTPLAKGIRPEEGANPILSEEC